MGSGERNEKSTICWKCQKACGNCSWSREFKPVEGWEATQTKVYSNVDSRVDSYIVHKCPEFKKDKPNAFYRINGYDLADMLGVCRGTIYNLTDDELMKLAKAQGVKLEVIRVNKKKISRHYYIDNRELTYLTLPKEFIKMFFGKAKGYTGF